MKYCYRCGQPLADEALFCQRCGVRQPDAAPVPPVSAPADTAAPAPDAAPSEPVPVPAAPQVPTPPFAPQPAAPIYPSVPPYAPGSYAAPPVYGMPPYAIPQPVPQPAPAARPAKEKLRTTLFFVWNMILIFLVNPIGTPLAVVGAVFASNAHACDDPEEARTKLHTSKVISIAVTCLDALCLAALIFFAVYYFARHPDFLGNTLSGLQQYG